jgi:excinuclease ABC subunit A
MLRKQKELSGGTIGIKGARQNNLKGFDLDLPLGRLIVVSGPSGSGKSSLAFDTLYAEGQRRYVETFSPYTRQFLERMDRPQVDEIIGIPPAVAIEQVNPVRTSRSTVGTITEINDYLKIVMHRLAGAACPECRRPVQPETVDSLAAHFLEAFSGQTMLLLFPVPVPAKTPPAEVFGMLVAQGYARAWIAGTIHRTDEAPPARLPGLIWVIQDRLAISGENRGRLAESIETAIRFGKGKIAAADAAGGADLHPFSSGWHCAHCDLDIEPPTPGLFSFNHPAGACPTCRGFGRVIGIDYARAIPDLDLSLHGGAIKPFQSENGRECQRDLMRRCAERDLDPRRKFRDLTEEEQRWVLYGDDPSKTGEALWKSERWYGVRGFFEWLESKAYKMHIRVLMSRYRSYTECPGCGGGRFRPETLNFRLEGKTLADLCLLPVSPLRELIDSVAAGRDDAAENARLQVAARLRYLEAVGLGYLHLGRTTRTLSGGELARVNLTSCLGASLVNTLFVLDEPSIGLHARDVGRLIRVIRQLRDVGNTVLVVEHDEAVLRAAEHLVELGPGRGESGGSVVFAGPPEGATHTLTGAYLTGKKRIDPPRERRRPTGRILVEKASANNLRSIDVEIPLGIFTCVTGVSGSGKSTLVEEVLWRNLARMRGEATDDLPGACRRIKGADRVGRVVMVDQSPLAKTPRSTPALYLGVFDHIREHFAVLASARAAGLSANAFSFNASVGRCPRCSGAGFEKVEMQFLSDLYLRCPLCEGKRYLPEVLKIRLKGQSIHDVLEMTVSEALAFFHADERIAGPLELLEQTGLGYLGLGQPLNTLSGGESQRLKLVAHLRETSGQGSLFIMDEPTTGLHLDDVATLLGVFDHLADAGHTLLVVEHHLEVIKCADHVIDLGPEAGADGGLVVAAGTPEAVAACEESITGRHLRRHLDTHRRGRKYAADLAGEDAGLRVAEEPPGFGASGANTIEVVGAREHNLKNISLGIPRDAFVVVTGLSGSGKSTLAFDLLFAEGQRRFLDTMSAYARQFVEQMEKPDVDRISGLPPTVAIEQRVTRGGGKSTVATVTEVYHFLRLLFARLGVQHCPKCDLPTGSKTDGEIVAAAAPLLKKRGARVLAPLVRGRKGFHTSVAAWAAKRGIEALWVDGKSIPVSDFRRLERFRAHDIDAIVGRGEGAVRLGLEIGGGTIRVMDASGHLAVLSREAACSGCGRSFEPLDPRLFSFNSPRGWCAECRGFGEIWQMGVTADSENILEGELREERVREDSADEIAKPCPVCLGSRLNEIARAVRFRGRGIADIVSLPAGAAGELVGKWKFAGREALIARDLVAEIRQRLDFISSVGLDYLSLGRPATTLSGGESQRVRLAAQLGSNLRGVLYVLDEPTIGLHPRDNQALLGMLETLKARGNSLLVVEHDEETMRRADRIIDLGPGAGSRGGEVVAAGTLDEILANADSATGRCLREPLAHPVRGSRRPLDDAPGWLTLSGARANNLKGLDLALPVGRLTVISGVSGSGKSTLMREVLMPAVQAAIARKKSGARSLADPRWAAIDGGQRFSAVYEVDQAPIGKTSRSTPSTYIKVFDEIRRQFASLPLARMRGYTASRFSFNIEGGRCAACTGQGAIKLEMSFLPPSYVPCGECGGRRYNAATLEVEYRGKSIADVMGLTVEEAATFFSAIPSIRRPMELLLETGLGYLKLGQPSPTLSGGEAQRIKLVSELARGAGRTETARLRGIAQKGSPLYLLEEPTVGLHMADVTALLGVLHRLVDSGATAVVIEHNLTVIAEADYLVDIGPEAGDGGGEIVAAGTPEQVAASKTSRTAPFLRALIKPSVAQGTSISRSGAT